MILDIVKCKMVMIVDIVKLSMQSPYYCYKKELNTAMI